MTDLQIRVAARKLCELRRQNPDQEIGHWPAPDNDGICYGVMNYSARWELVVVEIRDHLNIQASINYGKDQECNSEKDRP